MFSFFSTLRYVKKIDEMIVVKVPLQPHIYYQNLVVSIYQNPGFLLAGHCFDMFIASFFLKKKNEQIGPESVYIDFLSSTESPWRIERTSHIWFCSKIIYRHYLSQFTERNNYLIKLRRVSKQDVNQCKTTKR